MSRKQPKQHSHNAPKIQLPKDALGRLDIGQAFAEYDHVRSHPSLLVQTPAVRAATNRSSSKLFFVGRRGTGKTAITYALTHESRNAVPIYPEFFSLLSEELSDLDLSDTHQRAYRALIAAFQRALHTELLRLILSQPRTYENDLPEALRIEWQSNKNIDFDSAILRHARSLLIPLRDGDDDAWLRQLRIAKTIGEALRIFYTGAENSLTILFDRIDESWDGSQSAVIHLVALMHACLDLSSHLPWARALVLLRENVFERVRTTDNEFARLETCVVGLDWTRAELVKMIELRLNLPFTTRLPVDGTTWNYFFENGPGAEDLIFEYCQHRPRDVLTYCVLAIEMAQGQAHSQVMIEDLQEARKRFSDSRLKDLGDEYSENYPQISEVLSRFYGLGSRYTLAGVDALIQKLIVDDNIRTLCQQWIFNYTAPELFVRLFFDIGFWGFETSRGVHYRSLGPRATVPPAIDDKTELVIHPSYRPALDLREVLITGLDASTTFARPGLLSDLPDALDPCDYQSRLCSLEEDLLSLPTGTGGATHFEDIVGEILRLCFYRWLQNVKPHERDYEGTVIRDWVASNRAHDGFWEMIRTRYNATQVVWECKNYEDLKSDDFQQLAYYLNDRVGRFGIIAFRGQKEISSYYRHIRRLADDDKMVLPLRQRDLLVFIRQCRNGKIKEAHIQDIFDTIQRKTS